MDSDRLPDLLDDIRSMLDKGATSYDVDDFINQHDLSKEERSYLIRESQEYHINQIELNLSKDNDRIKYLLIGLATVIALVLLFMSGIEKVATSILSPIGLIILYFGYQIFKKNRKLRQ